MKNKFTLDLEIYLLEYFSDTVARFFKESEQRILYWDFRKVLDEKSQNADKNTSE